MFHSNSNNNNPPNWLIVGTSSSSSGLSSLPSVLHQATTTTTTTTAAPEGHQLHHHHHHTIATTVVVLGAGNNNTENNSVVPGASIIKEEVPSGGEVAFPGLPIPVIFPVETYPLNNSTAHPLVHLRHMLLQKKGGHDKQVNLPFRKRIVIPFPPMQPQCPAKKIRWTVDAIQETRNKSVVKPVVQRKTQRPPAVVTWTEEEKRNLIQSVLQRYNTKQQKVETKRKQSTTAANKTNQNLKVVVKAVSQSAASLSSSQPPQDESQGFIVDPSPCDVLFGRKKEQRNHGGNLYIRSLCDKNRGLFETRATEVVSTILQKVQDKGGRFLKRRSEADPWYVVDDEVAREKIICTMRDTDPFGKRKRQEKRLQLLKQQAAAKIATKTASSS